MEGEKKEMKPIEKLQGRYKIVWLSVANKVNEIIDFLNGGIKHE